MAVWCSKRSTGDCYVEFHFNFWRLPRRALHQKIADWHWHNQSDFVEIGILVDSPSEIDCIFIFVPFNVAISDILDCGPLFREADIAEGIFNEQIAVEIPPKTEGAYVELRIDRKTFCRVHKFESANGTISDTHLTLSDVDHGTLLKITRQAIEAPVFGIPDSAKTYFRLRVKMPEERENPFIQPVRPADWPLQSGFEQIELINFRMNEMRTLPEMVRNRLREEGADANAQVRLVAFLTAIPAISEMTSSSTPSHKSRVLEREIWDKYVDSGLPDDVAVYHWKKERDLKKGEAPINEFSAFVKLKQRRAGLGTVLVYILIAFLFGVLGNLAAGWLEMEFSFFQSFQEESTDVSLPNSDSLPVKTEGNE